MEIIIENDGLSEDEFHELASGETGQTLRKMAKNYLGSQDVAERQLKELQMQGGIDYELLRRDMTRHALNVAGLSPNLPIRLDITFGSGRMT